MDNTEKNITLSLNALTAKVDDLCSLYRENLDFQCMVYTYWTAKDVLGHLTFWHESFAKNLKDLVDEIKPNPLKGKLSEVNQMSVETTKNIPIEKLIKRIQKAQEIIEKNITSTSIVNIPYKKGSRSYSRLEHLQIVEGHINRHLKDLKKKMKTRPNTIYSK